MRCPKSLRWYFGPTHPLKLSEVRIAYPLVGDETHAHVTFWSDQSSWEPRRGAIPKLRNIVPGHERRFLANLDSF